MVDPGGSVEKGHWAQVGGRYDLEEEIVGWHYFEVRVSRPLSYAESLKCAMK